jgi:hypothetical protein
MRHALHRVDAHNPLVEPVKPGFCVCVPGRHYDMFACDIRDQTHGLCIWVGGGVGYCLPSGPVRIWSTYYGAQVAAQKCGGKVVTVPRVVGEMSTGVVRVWEDATE